MLIWMLWTNNDLKVPHRKQFNDSPNMKLVTSFNFFEFQPCGTFEGLSYYQGDEFIDPIIFVATVGLGNIINKLISSNFMGMVISVSVIFDTGATYSCYYNKGDFVKLEDKKFPINLKVIEKGLEISGFGIVEYSVRSESGRMIAIRAQEYIMFVGYQSIFASLPHKAFTHKKDKRVPSSLIFMMSKMVMWRLI